MLLSLLSWQFGFADENLPLVFQEDFESGANLWEPLNAKQWKVKKTGQGNVFSQFVKKSTFQLSHRSPALDDMADWDDVQLRGVKLMKP